MMKKFIIGCILWSSFFPLYAQHSLIYTHADQLFEEGKDLHHQRKYAASYRSFEAFLDQAEETQAGQRHEAEFYLIANAFELRQDRVFELVEAFMKKHPYSIFQDQLHVMLGTLLFEEEKFAEALEYFEAVNPRRLATKIRHRYAFHKAYALLETKAYHDALRIFKDLRDEESDFKEAATFYYAYTAYLLKDYDTALYEFIRIEQHPEYQEDVTYYLFQIYYQTGELDEVKRRGDYILKQYPHNPKNTEVYRIKGEIAYEEKNYHEAIEYLKRYEITSPQVLRNNLYILGIAHIRTNRYNSAIPYLKRVTTENDKLTENAYLHLGNAFIKINEKENARLAFEAALRTNFDSRVREEAMLNYALTTYETNAAFGAAISAFEQFLDEFPQSQNVDMVKSYLAAEYMATTDYEVAYQSIQKINQPNVKILEAKQYILYQLGTEAFAQHDFEKAIHYFTQAIQTLPNRNYVAESYYWRSESYYRLNQHDKSIQDLKTFMNLPNARNSTNYVAAHYGLGYAYFSQQNFKIAKEFFETYTKMERNKNSDVFADALNRIGDCYFYERDFRQAEMLYSRAANLSPNTADYALFQSAYVAGLQKKHTTKISRMNDLISTYPNSEYVDDALYEIGRAYLMLNNDREAITSYRKLVSLQPNSNAARKAALEIGMIQQNNDKLDEAVLAYQSVISHYTGTVEAFTALESLENIYVDRNDVRAYLDYVKSIDMEMPNITVSHEDSISYIAAEKQYMNENYRQAIHSFSLYLKNYCAGGRFCTNAQYYLADSYYRLRDFANALTEYQRVIHIPGNQFMEEALMRSAEITYDQQNFTASLSYFERFEKIAQTSERRNIARLGMLRCSYYLNDYHRTIDIASLILEDKRTASNVIAEARYNRAKSHLALNQADSAFEDLQFLSKDTRTAIGSESKYLLSQVYFDRGDRSAAEEEILNFAQKGTPYQYWLARGFILLSDIYIQQENDFQAKQYLLSLQRNYTVKDEIQDMIEVRLAAISKREKAKVIN